MQGHRYFYNKAVEKINTQYETRKQEFRNAETCIHCSNPKSEDSFCCENHQKKPLPWKLNVNFFGFCNELVKADSEIKDTELAWQSIIPYNTRQLAVKDAITAYKSAMTNKRRGHIQSFTMTYKSRRMPNQICWVDSRAIGRSVKKHKKHVIVKKRGRKKKVQKTSTTEWLTLFSTRLGEDKYVRVRKRQLKKLPNTFESACKLMKYGKYYYLVYTIDKKHEEIQRERHPLISLDPGSRTFQTGYSPSGVAIKFGERQRELMHKLHVRLDELRSKRDQCSSFRKQRLRIRCLKTEHKIRSLIDDLHNQTASYLSKQYETILLPQFGTSVMQKGTLLNSSTKRDLWSFSHYKFQQKLIGICQSRGTTLYIVGEQYTTKTCGSCGTLRLVGGAEVFRCTHCSYVMDRDVHGARNILLKHLTQHGA
jgi:transposase